MQKVALVTRHSSPEWVSCRSISTNLQASYLLLSDFDYRNFYFDPHDTAYDGRREALSIADWQAEKVVFLDHHPHPLPLLKTWTEERPEFKPELLFHVYGDFSLNSYRWAACEKDLRNFSVKFICASPKQATLIKKFLTDSEISSPVEVVPFPLEKKHFYWNSQVRTQTRSDWNVGDATVFFYSGRLSLQKNILQLIRSFEMYQRVIQPNSYLFIAGPVDDLGSPYLGKRPPAGLMSYDIQTLMKDSKNIHYLGILDQENLNTAYNASDVFISLSTHHDEDYGMSPAEALLTGCPCILTNWGGYSGFKNISADQVHLLPVHTTGSAVSPKEAEVVKMMARTFEIDEITRAQKAQQACDQLSTEAIARVLQPVLNKKENRNFQGFSPLFRKLSQSFSTHAYAPLSFGRSYSSLYKEIYDDYRN